VKLIGLAACAAFVPWMALAPLAQAPASDEPSAPVVGGAQGWFVGFNLTRTFY